MSAMAGLRVDRWENDNGHLYQTNIASGAVLLGETFPERSSFELSPSAGATWRVTDELDLHMAGQQGFREPTLNELYRPFRVGSTVTDANPVPVSYTHLDVYKRQIRDRRPGQGELIEIVVEGGTGAPDPRIEIDSPLRMPGESQRRAPARDLGEGFPHEMRRHRRGGDHGLLVDRRKIDAPDVGLLPADVELDPIGVHPVQVEPLLADAARRQIAEEGKRAGSLGQRHVVDRVVETRGEAFHREPQVPLVPRGADLAGVRMFGRQDRIGVRNRCLLYTSRCV